MSELPGGLEAAFKDQHLDKSQCISSNLWLFVGLNKDFKMNPVTTDRPHMDPGLKPPP